MESFHHLCKTKGGLCSFNLRIPFTRFHRLYCPTIYRISHITFPQNLSHFQLLLLQLPEQVIPISSILILYPLERNGFFKSKLFPNCMSGTMTTPHDDARSATAWRNWLVNHQSYTYYISVNCYWQLQNKKGVNQI